jgi:uncharacterized protein (DUF58 family)
MYLDKPASRFEPYTCFHPKRFLKVPYKKGPPKIANLGEISVPSKSKFLPQQVSQRLATWLETHWVMPAFAGGLLLVLALFFLAAASNTMVGWLYVISGVSLSLCAIAAWLPWRSLKHLQVRRLPVDPVAAGENLTVSLDVVNTGNSAQTLLLVRDMLPQVLGKSMATVVEWIPSQGSYRWHYSYPTHRRGVYRWSEVQLKTATPLGLFWCCRSRSAKAVAVVYPTVLPLQRCPLLDELGTEDRPQRNQEERRSYSHTSMGTTRTLRPYRWGDPIRLVHWRSSARYGELRVRELETFTSGQDTLVCLDTNSDRWQGEDFEQAVIAAASLYFYARHHQMGIGLWTASTGIVRGDRAVLETLAATNFGEPKSDGVFPSMPVVWLSANPQSLANLPTGSRWLLWPSASISDSPVRLELPGKQITPTTSLEKQLQLSLSM